MVQKLGVKLVPQPYDGIVTEWRRYPNRSRKVSQPNRCTHSSESSRESHSQIDGNGTPLNVVVFTIE